MNSHQNKLSKKEIFERISELKKNSSVMYRILADLGFIGFGIVGGGAIAAVTGSTAVPIGFGITTLTGWVITGDAPTGLIIGAAVAGGIAVYSSTQVVKLTASQQGKRKQMIQQLEEMLRDLNYQKTKSQTTEADQEEFLLFLEIPLRRNLVSVEDASNLIQLLQNGQISLFEAYKMVRDILNESESDRDSDLKST